MQGDVSVITGYLKSLFPGSFVRWEPGQDHEDVLYFVQGNDGRRRHALRFSFDFITTLTPFQIIRNLSEWNLKAHLERAGTRQVHVTGSGIALAETPGRAFDEPQIDGDVLSS